MKNCRIDTTRIEEIRNKIDSIEMLDQSLQAFPSNLDPKLTQTLERIRKTEKKKTPGSGQKAERYEGYSSADRRREFLGPLQERVRDRDMEVEAEDYEERYRPRTQMYGTSSKRYEDEDEYYGRQDRRDDYKIREEERYNYGDQYEVPHSGDFPPEDEFTFNRPTHERPVKKPSAKKSEQKSKSPSRKESTKKSVSKESKGKDRERSTSKKEKKGSLDHWIKSEEKDTKKSKDKSSKKTKDKDREKSSHKKKKGPTVHDFRNDSESSDDGKKSKSKKKKQREDSSAKKERGPQGLHDWINRRVTGYLIFHNTVHDEGLEKDGDHLNRQTGKLWQAMSKAEKEEYNSFAMNTRVSLKKQYRDIDIDDPELTEMQEKVDLKIKKIKKE